MWILALLLSLECSVIKSLDIEQGSGGGSRESNRLVITVFLPLSGDSGWDGRAYLPGLDIVRELVNNRSDLLQGYELVLEHDDSGVSDHSNAYYNHTLYEGLRDSMD